jgi:hypothetical protein
VPDVRARRTGRDGEVADARVVGGVCVELAERKAVVRLPYADESTIESRSDVSDAGSEASEYPSDAAPALPAAAAASCGVETCSATSAAASTNFLTAAVTPSGSRRGRTRARRGRGRAPARVQRLTLSGWHDISAGEVDREGNTHGGTDVTNTSAPTVLHRMSSTFFQ